MSESCARTRRFLKRFLKNCSCNFSFFSFRFIRWRERRHSDTKLEKKWKENRFYINCDSDFFSILEDDCSDASTISYQPALVNPRLASLNGTHNGVKPHYVISVNLRDFWTRLSTNEVLIAATCFNAECESPIHWLDDVMLA